LNKKVTLKGFTFQNSEKGKKVTSMGLHPVDFYVTVGVFQDGEKRVYQTVIWLRELRSITKWSIRSTTTCLLRFVAKPKPEIFIEHQNVKFLLLNLKLWL